MVKGLLALEHRPKSCHRETRNPLLSFHSHGAGYVVHTTLFSWTFAHETQGRASSQSAYSYLASSHFPGHPEKVVLGEMTKEEARQEARALMGEDDSGRTQSSLPPQHLPASSSETGFPLQMVQYPRGICLPCLESNDLESLSLTFGIWDILPAPSTSP